MNAPRRQRLPHAWVVYAAAAAPVLTILYAFSLGPSPHKQLAELRAAEAGEVPALLASFEAEALDVLVTEVERAGAPHRALEVRFLGERRHGPASAALLRICRDETAPEPLRVEALHALGRIDPRSAATAARDLSDAPRRLRAEASRLLDAERS